MSVLDPAPNHLNDLLAPEWLTGALGDDGQGRATSATVLETLRTVATKVRFDVAFEQAGGGTANRSYCVKGYFDSEGPGNGRIEALFYRDMAPKLGIRRPRCVYVGMDAANGKTLHIMDDLVADGCRFLTALTPYTREQAEASLAQLALLHAQTWGVARIADLSWLASMVASIPNTFPIEVLQGLLEDGRGEGLPPELRDAARLTEAMRRVSARDVQDRQCVVHGDAHAGNVYVDPDGKPGLIDWQIAHYGHWATDVAYHIATVLTIEDRRRHEQALLRGYLEELGRLGPTPPSWDTAWEEYRIHVAYGYYLWGITRMVDRDIIVEFIPRLGTAVADHEAYRLLGV